MKYDDLTLMKFADGELESALAKEIKNEILDDEELRARLEVFTSTTADKIRRAQEYGQILREKKSDISTSKRDENEEIPSHIIDLIDNFKPSIKQRLEALVYNIKTKYKLRTALISTILAAFIGFNLLPQVATKGVDFLDDSSAKNSNTYVEEVRLV